MFRLGLATYYGVESKNVAVLVQLIAIQWKHSVGETLVVNHLSAETSFRNVAHSLI